MVELALNGFNVYGFLNQMPAHGVTGLKSQKGNVFEARLKLDEYDYKVRLHKTETRESNGDGDAAGDGSEE